CFSACAPVAGGARGLPARAGRPSPSDRPGPAGGGDRSCRRPPRGSLGGRCAEVREHGGADPVQDVAPDARRVLGAGIATRRRARLPVTTPSAPPRGVLAERLRGRAAAPRRPGKALYVGRVW